MNPSAGYNKKNVDAGGIMKAKKNLIFLAGIVVALTVSFFISQAGRDGRGIEVSAVIQAPVEKVWAAFEDIERYPEWDAPMRFDSLPSEAGQPLSYYFVDETGKEGQHEEAVMVEYLPERSVRWRSQTLWGGLFDRERTLNFAPQADGSTLLVQREQFTGFLTPFAGSIVRQTQQNFERFGQELKSYVEQGFQPATSTEENL